VKYGGDASVLVHFRGFWEAFVQQFVQHPEMTSHVITKHRSEGATWCKGRAKPNLAPRFPLS